MEKILAESLPEIRLRWRDWTFIYYRTVRNWKPAISMHVGRKFQDVWLAQ